MPFLLSVAFISRLLFALLSFLGRLLCLLMLDQTRKQQKLQR